MSLQGLVQSFSTIHFRKCSAQAAPKRAEGRKDAASPLDKGVTSYLCPLSLQTQEAQVHHEVPWGLLVLSGLWVLPCQDLLKMDMASLTVRIPCQSPRTAPPQPSDSPEPLLGLCCLSCPAALLNPGPE